MFFFSGLLIAAACVAYSVLELHQSAANFFDPVAFAVVFGGTCAVAVITLPWSQWRELLQALRGLLIPKRADLILVAHDSMNILRCLAEGRTPAPFKARGLAAEIFMDGLELMQLGISTERLREILDERLYQGEERRHRIASSLRALAKYPPAFGLVGTVLGLVSLMRHISDNADASEAGLRMAVALVATLYGLLIANLVLNPAGEHAVKDLLEEKKEAELAFRAMMLCREGTTLLEAQEILNSYLTRATRINVLGGAQGDSEAA